MLNVGDKAPDFNLNDDSGNSVKLNDFKGKNIVLYFYPKDDTPGCTREACGFQEDQKKFKTKNSVILGVSADSVDSHGKFKNKYKLSFPLLSDPDRKTIKDYGVWKEKNMYGLKKMGIVRTTFIIDEKGKIARIFQNVKVDGHIEKVLSELN